MKPKVISTEEIYKGKIFDVSIVEIRDGEIEYKREIISHKGSAVIVPVFADKTVALVRQYRHAAGEYLLEIPAGTLNKDESPEIGAARELEEEIGVTAGKIEKLTEFYASPGFLTEKMYVFLATDLTETQQNLEVDELIEIEKITFHEAFEKIKLGEIQDAKTIISLFFAANFRVYEAMEYKKLD
jgi:ADP-ribose pyrophosphatase